MAIRDAFIIGILMPLSFNGFQHVMATIVGEKGTILGGDLR